MVTKRKPARATRAYPNLKWEVYLPATAVFGGMYRPERVVGLAEDVREARLVASMLRTRYVGPVLYRERGNP